MFEQRAAQGLQLRLVVILPLSGSRKPAVAEAACMASLASRGPLTSRLTVLGAGGARRAFGTVEPPYGPFSAFDLRFPGLVGDRGRNRFLHRVPNRLQLFSRIPDMFIMGGEPVLAGDVGLFLMEDPVLPGASVPLLPQGLARRARLPAKPAPDRLS